MKKEIWTIENGKLRIDYITWKGKPGFKIFDECIKRNDYYTFKESGTNYYLGSLSWSNLTNCFTPLYNNTKFMAFIEADITKATITKHIN